MLTITSFNAEFVGRRTFPRGDECRRGVRNSPRRRTEPGAKQALRLPQDWRIYAITPTRAGHSELAADPDADAGNADPPGCVAHPRAESGPDRRVQFPHAAAG